METEYPLQWIGSVTACDIGTGVAYVTPVKPQEAKMAFSWIKIPALINKIKDDIPAISALMQCLVKWDVTNTTDIPTGAKRGLENSTGTQLTIQRYDGSAWQTVKLMNDADKLDGYHATSAVSTTTNTIPIRDKTGLMQGNISGNAATADVASALADTLAIGTGGTGATSAADARSNLGVPPVGHASTSTTYGTGTDTNYGHVKLSSATDGTQGTSSGIAATPSAVKAVNDAVAAETSRAQSVETTLSGNIEANDAALRALIAEEVAKYLPLAGGTMTGAITAGFAEIINRSIATSALTFHGGPDWNQGASFQLFGKDHPDEPASFAIRCRDGSVTKDLIGRIGGTLTWDGNSVLTSNSSLNAAKLTGTLSVSTTGNAATATKLGTASKGATTQPIYLNAGAPTACTLFAGTGTAGVARVTPVSLNNSTPSKSATASGYFQIGNLLICYGHLKSGADHGTITFPRSFTTVTSIICTYSSGSTSEDGVGGYGDGPGVSNVGTNSFRYDKRSGVGLDWMAIGYHS